MRKLTYFNPFPLSLSHGFCSYFYLQNFWKFAFSFLIICIIVLFCVSFQDRNRWCKSTRWESSCADTMGIEMVLEPLVRQSRMEKESAAAVHDQGLRDLRTEHYSQETVLCNCIHQFPSCLPSTCIPYWFWWRFSCILALKISLIFFLDILFMLKLAVFQSLIVNPFPSEAMITILFHHLTFLFKNVFFELIVSLLLFFTLSILLYKILNCNHFISDSNQVVYSRVLNFLNYFCIPWTIILRVLVN